VFARLSTYELPVDRTRDASRAALTIWEDGETLTASRVAATRLRSEAMRSIDGEVVSIEEFAVAVHRES
jgi:hypothetical protein